MEILEVIKNTMGWLFDLKFMLKVFSLVVVFDKHEWVCYFIDLYSVWIQFFCKEGY